MKSTKPRKTLSENKKDKSESQSNSKKSRAGKDKNEIIMDMPEVKDIPGQEHIQPPRVREMMDTTVSSADEEGDGLLDDLNKEDENDYVTGKDNNVSETERRLLDQSDRPLDEEGKDLKKLVLDKTDGSDKLNEDSDPRDLGSDLDVPGAELDDENEEVGEEDEENNSYSRPD